MAKHTKSSHHRRHRTRSTRHSRRGGALGTALALLGTCHIHTKESMVKKEKRVKKEHVNINLVSKYNIFTKKYYLILLYIMGKRSCNTRR